ncbi:MAG: LuxR C-terminal-related transcriptional regulator [Sedimentibacter sp.]|uniref:response regulator transcription factor n=1 Tax=Sedimentibacter sp. TaxID=1960295 RepID=UPI0031598E61
MFTVNDYEKLLDFQSQIYSFDDDIRHTILQALQTLYQGYSIAFFFADDNEQYINPPDSINIDADIMRSYEKYYFKTDIFHTINIPKNLLKKNIIHITDIMSLNDFEKTEFYNDNLRKMDVYDEIALQLHYKNQLLGVIGIMKPKHQGTFTEKEIQYAEFVRRSVTPLLRNSLERLRLQHENSLIMNLAKEAPVGMVVIDSKFNLINYNQHSLQYVKEIWECDDDNNFNKVLVKNLANELYFKGLTYETSLQTNVKKYTFKLVPVAVPDLINGFKTYYVVYIMKNENSSAISYNKLKTIYNLTDRECEIIFMLSQGYSNKRIADELYLSLYTVKAHMQNIFKKMDSNSRTEVLHKIILND